jgi:hypothetical protein
MEPKVEIKKRWEIVTTWTRCDFDSVSCPYGARGECDQACRPQPGGGHLRPVYTPVLRDVTPSGEGIFQ